MRAIVTGASSGIGRAVALLAAETGRQAHLMLVGQNAERLEEVAMAARAKGASVMTCAASLADADACIGIVRRAIEAFAGLDALICCAGAIRGGMLKDLDLESYDAMFDINTRPLWLMSKAAYEALKEARGSIVVTTSISGEQPTPRLGSYSASKAALTMLAKQIALEWGPDGIRCNCVAPGATYTGMTATVFNDESDPAQLENRRRREASIPLRRIGQPEDCANMILYLAGPLARQITGVSILVDGGQSLALMPSTGGGSGHAISAR